MRHLWVLAVAGMLVVLLARPTAVPAAPMLRNLAAIQINAVVENSATVTALAVRPARTVGVQPGQSLATLSTEYRVSPTIIRWGNRLTQSMAPAAGSMLLIPPG